MLVIMVLEIIMKSICAVISLLFIMPNGTFAGDDASGAIPFAVDLSKPFTTYVYVGS